MEIRLLFWQRVQDVTHGSWEEVRRAALQVEISREISPYKQSKDVILNVIVFFSSFLTYAYKVNKQMNDSRLASEGKMTLFPSPDSELLSTVRLLLVRRRKCIEKNLMDLC